MMKTTLALTLGLSCFGYGQEPGGFVKFGNTADNYESVLTARTDYVSALDLQDEDGLEVTVMLRSGGEIDNQLYRNGSYSYFDTSLVYSKLTNVGPIDTDGNLHTIISGSEGTSPLILEDVVDAYEIDDPTGTQIIALKTNGQFTYLTTDGIPSFTVPSGNKWNQFYVSRRTTSSNAHGISALDELGFIHCWKTDGDTQAEFLSPPGGGGFIKVVVGYSCGGECGFVGVALHENGDVYMWGIEGSSERIATGYIDVGIGIDPPRIFGQRQDGTADWDLLNNSQTYPEDIAVIKVLDAYGRCIFEPPATPYTATPGTFTEVIENANDYDEIQISEGLYDLSKLAAQYKSLTISGSGSGCQLKLPSISSESFNLSLTFRDCEVLLDDSDQVKLESAEFYNCIFKSVSGENDLELPLIIGEFDNHFSFYNCDFSQLNSSRPFCRSNWLRFEGSDLSPLNLYLDGFDCWVDLKDCEFNNLVNTEPYRGAVTVDTYRVTLNLNGTTFNNCSGARGGAICVLNSQNFSFPRCWILGGSFESNTAIFGGAIYSAHSYMRVTGSTFKNNLGSTGTSVHITSIDGLFSTFPCVMSECSVVSSYENFASEISTTATDLAITKTVFSGRHGDPENLFKSDKSIYFISDSVFCQSISTFDSVPVVDLGGNMFEDSCDQVDCNSNGQIDSEEIESGSAVDCDFNGILDSCELANNPSLDCDQSGTLDSCDVENGTLSDCNQNQIGDSCEIAENPTLDANDDGVIDSCQCITDINQDGVTDFTDIVQLLSCWEQEVDGVCAFADVDQDDAIGFGDLLLVLSGFGPC